jgi:hypothetical protein
MYLEAPIVARDKESLRIYAVIHFWAQKALFDAGQPPIIINDFLMQLVDTITQVKVIGGRLVRLDGVRVRPEDVTEADEAIGWQRETINKTNPQLIAEVEENILNYWRRANAAGVTGDQRSFRSVTEADPDGILTKVMAFKGGHDYPAL